MIKVLTEAEVRQLDSIFESEWNAYVPCSNASIVAEIDDDELIAFVPLEDVILISGVYVAPNHRGISGAKSILKIVDRIQRSAANSGRSFIMARHSDRADHFLGMSERLGFRKYADAVYRTDKFRRD